MQIELIGCTSAGKSSLAKNILQGYQQNGLTLVTSYDFVLRWAHLDWIKHHRIRMLFLNLITLIASLFTWRKNLEFYRFAIGVIRRLPAQVRFFEKLKIARIAARNVGIYEMISRFSSERQVVLADEGTLHIAHYLFVHVSTEPNMSDLETFVRLVSLPDVAVYVKQPESVLVARTMARRHKRIPQDASALAHLFVKHSLSVFEKLVACSALGSRLLVVNGAGGVISSSDPSDSLSLAFAGKIIAAGIDPGKTDVLAPVKLDPGESRKTY